LNAAQSNQVNYVRIYMKRISKTVAGVSAGVALGVAAAVIAHLAIAGETNLPAPKFNLQTTPVMRESRVTSFSPVIKKAAPSVVNIYSTRTVHLQVPDDSVHRFWGGDDADARPRRSRTFPMEGLGSGVIVSADGYILTASHLIEDADDVKITLADGQKKLDVKIVGSDPATDVAVLKVDAKNLPAITLADSDKLEVGDVVLAIGNPFEVGQSVSMGIVSGLGRNGMGISRYENFIQTDAAINMGNSGGALVDAEGRLIGINTAILSRSGGNQGIGFAVPINLAREMMERIIKDGKVTRGFLGVDIESLNGDLAKEFNVPVSDGALINDVLPNTPAAKAGLKEGDVIVELNGARVTGGNQFHLAVSELAPDSKASLKVLRGSTEKNISVTLAEFPTPKAADAGDAENGGNGLEGVALSDLTPKLRSDYSVPNRIQGGAVVTKVAPDSAAEKLGLKAGDVILSVNHQPVTSASEVTDLIHKAPEGKILLRVRTHDEDGNPTMRFLIVPNDPHQ